MNKKNRVKCRFCDFVPKLSQEKDQRALSLQDHLWFHAQEAHPEEFEKFTSFFGVDPDALPPIER